MAASRKSLGQVAPAATTETDLYNSPTTVLDTVVGTVVICNRGGTSTTFRISVCPEADTTATTDYLFYDCPIAANETIVAQLGITLPPDWDVRVYAGTADLTFNAFGQENSA